MALELGARPPELGEEDHVQHAAQVVHAGGAAGAALEADDALHGRRVAETPLPEGVLEVHELLGELVELPVALGAAVDLHPRLAHGFVELVQGTPVPLDTCRVDPEAAAGE